LSRGDRATQRHRADAGTTGRFRQREPRC
jgi:hypothetical protein